MGPSTVDIEALTAGLANIDLDSITENDITLAFESSIFKATFDSNTSNLESQAGNAIWERPDCYTANDNNIYSRTHPKSRNSPYDELSRSDFELQGMVNTVAGALDHLHATTGDPEGTVLAQLQEGTHRITRTLAHIRSVNCASVEETTLKEEMLKRYDEILSGMEQAATTIRLRHDVESVPHAYDNRRSFESNLDEKNPVTLFAAFIIIALNVFGSLVREWASTALKLQLELLKLTFNCKNGGMTNHEQDLLSAFPQDIRTARKLFNVEAITTTYMACPTCSATYRVDNSEELRPYCTQKQYPKDKVCGAKLTKLVIKDINGERRNVRVPIRPFLIQDFDAFKASLLNRPGMEAILDRGTLFNDTDDMWDIKDGTVVKDLLGPDGRPFWDGLKRSELRLLWTLSIDWFNPRGNKIAGKVNSTGSIVMSCINLPQSLRYKPENLFLVGVIPGPREPSVEEVQHFIEPIVDMLDHSWKNGTTFQCTESSDHGRTERSMLAVIVADLVANRKITGVASHSSKEFFCSLCSLGKDNINNFVRETWPTRTREAQRRAAEQWRDASTKAERKRLFKKTGIHWSPFWKLDYYDPTKISVADPMHNLFLGLVQFHVREILGAEDAQNDESRPATENEIESAGKALDALKIKALNHARVPVLKKLCTERGIVLESVKRLKKKSLVQMLIGQLQESSLTLAQTETARTGGPMAPLLIGEEYFEPEKSLNETREGDVFVDKVTKAELKQLQQNIQDVVRPPYRRGPPSNLGEPGHGKLKAEQWRTCIEFDIPVSIAQLWAREMAPRDQAPQITARRDKIFESIMLLAVALRWGTSYRSSDYHIRMFEKSMKAYLQSLLDLYPDIKFRPNHHMTLHIAPLLAQFGPVHGWWMFPFERVIGLLQKINTNSRMGELEATMLKTFCAAANLKALLQGEKCPAALKMAVPVLKKKWEQDRRTGAIGEVNNLKNVQTRNVDVGRQGMLLTDEFFEEAFTIGFKRLGKELSKVPKGQPRKITSYKRVNIGGRIFATKAQARNEAEVFFQPCGSDKLIPGVIVSIMSIRDGEDEVFALSIFPRKPPPSGIANPFARFPDFGSELWSTELEAKKVFIPTTQNIHHSESRPWAKGVLVLKPIKPAFQS